MNQEKVIGAIVLTWAIVGAVLLRDRPISLIVHFVFPVFLGVFVAYSRLAGESSKGSGVSKVSRPENPSSATSSSQRIAGESSKVSRPENPSSATGSGQRIAGESSKVSRPENPSSATRSSQEIAGVSPKSTLTGRISVVKPPPPNHPKLSGKELHDSISLFTRFSSGNPVTPEDLAGLFSKLCENLGLAEAQVYIVDQIFNDYLDLKVCYPTERFSAKKVRFKWKETSFEKVMNEGEQLLPGEAPPYDFVSPIPIVACTPLIDGKKTFGIFNIEKTVRPFVLASPDPEFLFFCGQMAGFAFGLALAQEKAENQVDDLTKKITYLEQHREKLEQTAAFLDQEVDRQYFENVDLEKQHSHLFSSFQKFLSPIVIEKIVSDPSSLKLGGVKRNVTIFFSDIRGFTKLSEGMDPTVIVGMLNQYFSAMTAIVMKYLGTLDKFVGDEIMALFGAPIGIPDATVRAVMCALEMQQKLVALKTEWETKNLPLFEIGIGINYGEVTVGFLGSEQVLSYTAIGDPVNLASRLCSLAESGQIIVSSDTARELGGCFFLRELPELMVKGKELPVKIFEVLSPAKDLSNIVADHLLSLPSTPPEGAILEVS